MHFEDLQPTARRVKKSLTETVVRSVTEIRYADNTVNYAITETLTRSLLVEDAATDYGLGIVTSPILDTAVNMTRTWLEPAPPQGLDATTCVGQVAFQDRSPD